MNLKNYIRSIPDFPKEGILFYDISTLLAHPDEENELRDFLLGITRNWERDHIAYQNDLMLLERAQR